MSDLGDLPPRRHQRPTAVWANYRDRLRGRWLQELLAIAGIAVGVALLYSSSVANMSLSGPVRQLSDGIVGNSQLQVVARGPDGLPVSLADRLRTIDGVRIAAPVLQVQANVVGPRGQQPVTIFGADPRVVQLRGNLLEGFTRGEAAEQKTVAIPEPIARHLGIRFGDDGRLEIAGRSRTVPMAVVARSQIGPLAGSAIALAPIAYLQSISGMPGRATRILIQAAPDQLSEVREDLQAAVGPGTDVLDTDHDAALFDRAAQPTSQSTAIASIVGALVGWLFAVCALLITVEARGRIARDLRSMGYRGGQVALVLALDAVVLGIVAVAVGLGIGEVMSRSSGGSDIGFLGGAFPIGDMRVVRWSSFALAAAGGLLAALVGVLGPIWRLLVAEHINDPPHPSARRRHGQLLRLLPVGGIVLLLVSIAITVLAPASAIVALIALVGSLLLLVPGLLWAATSGLDRLSDCTSPAPQVLDLALPALQEPAWRARALAIATTGAIAVFGAVALQGSRTNLQAGLDGVSHELDLVGDVWVTPRAAGDLVATVSFPDRPGVRQRIADVAGVREVGLYRGAMLDIAGGRAWVLAPPDTIPAPIPAEQIREGTTATAQRRVRGGGWITLSRAIADDLRVDVGDTVVLPTPRPQRFRVAAITTNLGWTGGAIVANAEDFARAWGSDAISAYLVQTSSDANPSVVRDRIQAALGPRSALRVEANPERWQRQKDASRGGLSQLSQIASLTLVAAVLAMAAAMTGLLWQRRNQIARAKYDGHRTGPLWGALAVEAGTLFAVGALAGAVFGVLGQVLLTRGLEVIIGFPVVVGVRIDVAALCFGAVTVVALLAIAIPGLLVARSQPTPNIDD